MSVVCDCKIFRHTLQVRSAYLHLLLFFHQVSVVWRRPAEVNLQARNAQRARNPVDALASQR